MHTHPGWRPWAAASSPAEEKEGKRVWNPTDVAVESSGDLLSWFQSPQLRNQGAARASLPSGPRQECPSCLFQPPASLPGSPRVSTRSSPVGTRPTRRVRQLQLEILNQICKDLISKQGLILKFQTDMNFGGPCSTPYRTQADSVPEGAPHELMLFLPTSNAENLNKEGLSMIIDSTHFQEQG